MLAAIGVAIVEELFAEIPAGRAPRPPARRQPALTEAELWAHLTELAGRNVAHRPRALVPRRGIYDHYVPAVVDPVHQRGELLTAYTPYQPEMSQGTLQAIFEYQTAICELTGMDVSNASGYDGTTVAADACYVAKQTTGRAKVVVAADRSTRRCARWCARSRPASGWRWSRCRTPAARPIPTGSRRPARARPARSSRSRTSSAASSRRPSWPRLRAAAGALRSPTSI